MARPHQTYRIATRCSAIFAAAALTAACAGPLREQRAVAPAPVQYQLDVTEPFYAAPSYGYGSGYGYGHGYGYEPRGVYGSPYYYGGRHYSGDTYIPHQFRARPGRWGFGPPRDIGPRPDFYDHKRMIEPGHGQRLTPRQDFGAPGRPAGIAPAIGGGHPGQAGHRPGPGMGERRYRPRIQP